ncbi:MAG: hypothetical protein ACYDCN_04335 [Bacteroidia bacterium]
MKKITVIASLFIAALTTSCAKQHVCTCVITPTTGPTETDVITYDKITMANAKLACETQSQQTVQTVSGNTQTNPKSVCTLK